MQRSGYSRVLGPQSMLMERETTPIKWFGITLFIGVAVSMFTAITVTRTLLRLFIGSSLATKTWLFTAGGGKK